jgi:hypothetical protein
MTKTLCAIAIVISFGFHGNLLARTYAEVMAGISTPTGISSYRDQEAERVSPGDVATTLTIAGLFRLSEQFTLSPSYSYLSTNGNVAGSSHPTLPATYDIKFQQNELALDLMWLPGGLNRFRFGPGISASWWHASEKLDHPQYAWYKDSRVTRGQSYLLRGVAHFMLRSPSVTGFSVKLVGAVPLTQVLRIKDSAATGYIGINCGFSMIVL